MTLVSTLKRHSGTALLGVSVLFALYVVSALYAAGEWLLAGTMLITASLALWIYTSAKTYAFRYLFPGIAAALIFVVFPMVYTVTIGFTNYSSRNLLDHARAQQYLLDETFRAEGASYALSLHPDGAEYRIKLENADDGSAYLSAPLALAQAQALTIRLEAAQNVPVALEEPLPIKAHIERQAALKDLTIQLPTGPSLKMSGLREFAAVEPLYEKLSDGRLQNRQTKDILSPNFETGFFETASGERVPPGFQVSIGWDNYSRIFTEAKFREPFLQIFLWTVIFSGLTVLFASSLGMLLAVMLNWDALHFKGFYRLLLFIPYAVPAFISILVFKGLFNNNSGEINLILSTLFGIKPTWFSDPFLAKSMLLIVNTWLGFPYMMVVCMGLIKAIPADLYEASAVAGAGPLTNFFRITLPLILKPLTPLLIASFAFNFNNFVLIALLTGGRPDFLNTTVPAGTTDLLVSYTWRIAFEDSGKNFGLAAAISTVIFLMVAVLALVQMKFTRVSEDDAR